MTKLLILSGLLFLFSLSGCIQNVLPDASTQPVTEATTIQTSPVTTFPTESTALDTTPAETTNHNALSAEEIETLEGVFSIYDYLTYFRTNWYNAALCTEYDSQHPLDLADFLGNQGTGHAPDYDLTEEEIAYIRSFPRMAAHMDMECRVLRISKEDVEDLLELYFGLSLDEVDSESDTLVYWQETDCYYAAIDDGGWGIMDFEVIEAEFLDNGTIWFSYEDASSATVKGEAVILPVPGGFQMISNKRT